jgi:hypothetical protein
MPWKHVGDARLLPTLRSDTLSIDVGGEDHQYVIAVPNVRATLDHRVGSRLYRRYSAGDGTHVDIETAVILRRSRSGLAVTFAADGHLYAINASRLREVLDGLTPAVRVVERIDDAGQLSDATSRQATLGVF